MLPSTRAAPICIPSRLTVCATLGLRHAPPRHESSRSYAIDGSQRHSYDPRYPKITQLDLQREFYKSRQNTIHPYRLPALSVSTASTDLPGIHQALVARRNLLEMYRRQISDDKTSLRLQRLDRRLLDIAQQLQNIAGGEK